MKDNQNATALLESAVEILAASKGVQAKVQSSGKHLSVRLSRPGQLALDTEATAKGWRQALRQAEAALAGPFFSKPAPLTSEYLRPLDSSVGEKVLTAEECETCRVFALEARHTEDNDDRRLRWAVCEPCLREQWHNIGRDEVIIYTELYTFGPSDDEPGATSLVTYIGRLLVYDEQRGLFYATMWDSGEQDAPSLTADDVQEVWRVVRFVPASKA